MYKAVLVFIVFLSLAFSTGNIAKAKNSMPFKSCINIGNALDAPNDKWWGVTLQNRYFDVIKEAGFDAVRLPVRFSDYAKDSPGYVLDEQFMEKLDRHIDYALKKKLVLILDFHHFVEIMQDPKAYKACFLAVWEQLAIRYKDYPPELIFEILNEPQKKLCSKIWNEYMNEAVAIIRKHDARRHIIIGGSFYNSMHFLDELHIPKTDNIILTFHYYEPETFTFQGNPYHEGFEHLKNIKWTASKKEMKKLRADFAIVKAFAEKNNLPVFLGEFGVTEEVPEKYREKWIKAVVAEAGKNAFAWGYWEFCSSFGIYDNKTKNWNDTLLDALLR